MAIAEDKRNCEVLQQPQTQTVPRLHPCLLIQHVCCVLSEVNRFVVSPSRSGNASSCTVSPVINAWSTPYIPEALPSTKYNPAPIFPLVACPAGMIGSCRWLNL
jgi:hypothetical protein